MNRSAGNCVEPQTQPQKVGIDEGAQTEPMTCETTDSSTRTTTVDAFIQTTPLDDTTPNPSSPPTPATSPLMMPAQPPSATPTLPSTTTTSSTTTTTFLSPALKLPPASRKRWQTLPSQLIDPQQDPQPLLLSPKPRHSTATSPSTTAMTSETNGRKTTTWATTSTQTAAPTLETANQAMNDVQGTPNTQTKELRDNEHICSSKCVVCLMK